MTKDKNKGDNVQKDQSEEIQFEPIQEAVSELVDEVEFEAIEAEAEVEISGEGGCPDGTLVNKLWAHIERIEELISNQPTNGDVLALCAALESLKQVLASVAPLEYEAA